MTRLKNVTRPTLATALASLLLCGSFASASEGGSNGGGGSGVVQPDNTVRFVDLMSNSEIVRAQSNGLKFSEVIERFYKSNQFVKQAAAQDTDFFKCAQSILNGQGSHYPVLRKLSSQLQSVNVVQVQFQIITVEEGADYNNLNLPIPLISTASRRLSFERQEALATYVRDQLWVSNRLYTKMSTNDQCGLSVHESLRHLNQTNLLEESLTQDEIENATRLLMGYSVARKMRTVIAKKLSHPLLTSDQYEFIATSNLEKAKVVLSEMTKMGVLPTDPANANVWRRQMDKYQTEINVLSAEESHASARAVLGSLSSSGVQKAEGELGAVTYYPGLAMPLTGSKYMDVVNFKIVERR